MTISILGVAAVAITAIATTSAPVQAAGNGAFAPKHRTDVPADAVKTTKRPEALGSHGPKFAPNRAQTRVVGGTTANSSDFPGVVGVRDYFQQWNGSSYDQFLATCTGTLISPTKVLTAAHCVTDWSNGDVQVIAGRNTLTDTTSGTVYGVSNVWTDQGFNLGALYDGASTPLDDVVVLTLRTPADSVYTPYPITAQGDQTPYTDGTNAVIAGYGVTTEGGSDVGTLHEATVPMVADATCAATASADGDSYDANRMTCAGVPAPTPGGNDGVDTCGGDSGGPLLVNGVEAAITDWGPSTGCASSYGYYERLSYYNSAISADVNRTNMPVNLDFSGDGHADLMVRLPDGTLGQISGAGLMMNDATYGNLGGISDAFAYDSTGPFVSTGWGMFTRLFRVTNWNGDHTESIFGMKSNGTLWQYKTDGNGHFKGSATQIGTGWTIFNTIVVTNNWMGDGRPNLMGRTATGDLIVYTSNGSGGWVNAHGTKIGTGWNIFNTILTPGNWRGNGQSLIGRTTTGDLRLYESNGHGGWLDSHGTKIGSGWNTFPTFFSPGDWNGDNLIDLVGISSTGAMKLYRTNGTGTWLDAHGTAMTGGWWPSAGFSGLYVF